MQKELLESAHVNDGGHCGINRSRKILTARCFWEGMSEDVVDYISKCDRCQKSRINKLQKGSEDLHPIPVPRKSMEPGWDRHYDDEKGRGIQIPDNRDGLFLEELRNARIEN